MNASIAIALALSGPAEAPKERGIPQTPAVKAKVVQPKPAPVVVSQPVAYTQAIQTTYRQPVGHTHTCQVGHTWDHTLNPGHNCPALVVRGGKIVPCGLPQYVQDARPRMVTITKAVSVPVSPGVTVERPVTLHNYPERTMILHTPSWTNVTLPGNLFQGGGCVGGNCPNLRR